MTDSLSKKKIYMAGVGGMLGEAFYTVFKNDYIIKCTDKDVNTDWLGFLDFRDSEAYKADVLAFKPDYLFHIGAYTDLEFCENNKADAYITNYISVITATEIANELNIPLLYISTAGIFDGKQEQYIDSDQPNPMGHYAKSKYQGERYVVENAKHYFICRAGWMMGGGPSKDKKFISKLIKQIEAGKKELNIVDDKDGTPTYTIDFALNTKKLVETDSFGLYNMVCGGQTSRYEVAEVLLDILRLNHEIKLNKVSSDYFKEQFFAPRPPCECLINKRLNDQGMNLMRDWKEALKIYLETSYPNLLNQEKPK